MKYFLPRDYKYKHVNDAGSKARMDIEHIMSGAGYVPVAEPFVVSKSRLCHFVRTIEILVRAAMVIRKGDILVLQYPTKYYSLICRLVHLRGAEVVTFIHDLQCFRNKRNSEQREIALMNMSDALIGCNPSTCGWLLEHGFVGHGRKKVVESLGAFDFLSDAVCPDRKATWPLRKIVYAGQLSLRKNRFLYDFGSLMDGYSLNVYGRGFDRTSAANSDKFDTKGFMLPDNLIRTSEGDFGLVWDGGSVDCCDGDWGSYLMINTPHKISLYIRCGLPLIIWEKAAMAAFVRDNGIGICVSSLRDIAGIYERLTRDEYNRMCDNVMRVGRQMAEGRYFERAVSAAVKRMR